MPKIDSGMWRRYSWRKYSQNNEDGILDYLFTVVKPTYSFYVEIGISPPESTREDNCRLLYETGWTGLRVDSKDYPGYGCVREFVTPQNINILLTNHRVPHDFDLFSLDIDGQDSGTLSACGQRWWSSNTTPASSRKKARSFL